MLQTIITTNRQRFTTFASASEASQIAQANQLDDDEATYSVARLGALWAVEVTVDGEFLFYL